MSVQNLNLTQKGVCKLKNINLTLNTGEILGIAGVEGNGQSELLRALLLLSNKEITGQIQILGQDAHKIKPKNLRSLGVGVFAEDRLRQALLVDSTLEDNLLLGYQRTPANQNFGVLKKKAIRKHSNTLLSEFDVRPPNPAAIAGSLSGGNQQKVVVARELSHVPKLLLAAQPTRGVDVLAIHFIHERMLQLKANGSGILLFSSELDELLKLSDRILVLFSGQIVGDFLRADFDEHRIGSAMGGANG